MRDPDRGSTGAVPSSSYPAGRGNVDSTALGVGEVARRLGVAPPTLRSWGRRYGLEPSGRSDGGHRRYTAADVVRLQTVLRLVRQGVPTAAAAESVRGGTVPAEALMPAWTLPDAADRQRMLWALADRMDVLALRSIVEAALGSAGVVPVWTDLLAPLLRSLDRRRRADGAGAEVGRLTTEVLTGCLHRYTGHLWSRRPPDPAGRPVLLAGLAGEQHTLPLLAISAALAEHRALGQVLGAGVPVPALAAAIARSRPAAVLVWASDPSSADVDAVTRLVRARPSYPVVLGGAGWPRASGGPVLRLAPTVAEATAVLAAGVLAAARR
ncbi:MAG TPA: MerR family transcriptional regulator [Kribbellaceae bacterium]